MPSLSLGLLFLPLLVLGMGNWRNHGEDHHQHWSRSSSSSSYNKKPPLSIWKPTVPRWEKQFCASVGISWSKLVETKKFLCLHEKVMNWDDSAGREEFDNAKKRFWASMNDFPCDIPLPDPNTYNGDIDWNSIVDPELILDLEKCDMKPIQQQQGEKVLIPGGSLLLNQYHTPYYSHFQAGKNNAWGWNLREHYQSYTYGMGRDRAGWNMKTWYGDDRSEENITWHKAPEYPDKINFQIGSEMKNNPLWCNVPNA